MEKFIPYEKLSKKEKRKIDQARRQTWGASESRYPKAGKQQGLQQKEITGMEAESTAHCLCFFICCVPALRCQFLYFITFHLRFRQKSTRMYHRIPETKTKRIIYGN